MRKRLRIAGIVCCGLLLVIAAVLVVLYQGARRVPEAYREAIELDPAVLKEASDQMLRRATALAGDVKQEGRWQALFSDRQINGWLAVDLVENHPDALPPSMSDPRVAIAPDRLMLYCRLRRGSVDSVVTVTVEPYVPEPNVLALRIRRARAGLVPVPLQKVLDAISQAVGRTEMRLAWRQAEGDPVAVITIPPPHDEDDKLVEVESLRLGEGEIYLSGRTQRRRLASSSPEAKQ